MEDHPHYDFSVYSNISISMAYLAEVDLHLDWRLQGLHIVENEWEGDEAASDGDSAEDDGGEGHWPKTLLLFLGHSLSCAGSFSSDQKEKDSKNWGRERQSTILWTIQSEAGDSICSDNFLFRYSRRPKTKLGWKVKLYRPWFNSAFILRSGPIHQQVYIDYVILWHADFKHQYLLHNITVTHRGA